MDLHPPKKNSKFVEIWSMWKLPILLILRWLWDNTLPKSVVQQGLAFWLMPIWVKPCMVLSETGAPPKTLKVVYHQCFSSPKHVQTRTIKYGGVLVVMWDPQFTMAFMTGIITGGPPRAWGLGGVPPDSWADKRRWMYTVSQQDVGDVGMVGENVASERWWNSMEVSWNPGFLWNCDV